MIRGLPLLFAVGCGPHGPAFVVSEVADGPALHVTASEGEIDVPFTVSLDVVAADGKPPPVEYGFDVAWTVTSEASATVRFVTFTDVDVEVPTPWEVDVRGEETFTQSSATHTCARDGDGCEAAYDVAIEVRDGDAVDLAWQLAAWAQGRPGSADKVADETALDVVFE